MIDELKVIRFFPLHLLDTASAADDGSQMPTKADIIGELRGEETPKICKA